MKTKTIWLFLLLLLGLLLFLPEKKEEIEVIEIIDYGDSNDEITIPKRNLINYFDGFVSEELKRYCEENFIIVEEMDYGNEPIPEVYKQPLVTYGEADRIWQYLLGLGYNEYVCAGILGNIMAEVGGCSLRLVPTLVEEESGSFYGICQWSKKYKEVWYTDLDFQLDFLRDTIEYEFAVFGRLYKEGFTYSDFLELQDETEAALAFAKVYERCAKWTYSHREENATVALNYFGYGY